MTINPFFEWKAFGQFLEREITLLRTLAVDVDRPGLGFEPACGEGRRLFVGAELVIVVVGGDLFPAVRLFLLGLEAELAGFHAFQLSSVRSNLTSGKQLTRSREQPRASRRNARRRLQKIAAVEVPL